MSGRSRNVVVPTGHRIGQKIKRNTRRHLTAIRVALEEARLEAIKTREFEEGR